MPIFLGDRRLHRCCLLEAASFHQCLPTLWGEFWDFRRGQHFRGRLCGSFRKEPQYGSPSCADETPFLGDVDSATHPFFVCLDEHLDNCRVLFVSVQTLLHHQYAAAQPWMLEWALFSWIRLSRFPSIWCTICIPCGSLASVAHSMDTKIPKTIFDRVEVGNLPSLQFCPQGIP